MAASADTGDERLRAAERAEEPRPVEACIPDIRQPDFAAECRRQSLAVAAADAADPELTDALDAILADLNGEDEAAWD